MATATTTREPTMMGVLVSPLAIVAGGVCVKSCVLCACIYRLHVRGGGGEHGGGLVRGKRKRNKALAQLFGGAAQRLGMHVAKAMPGCVQS